MQVVALLKYYLISFCFVYAKQWPPESLLRGLNKDIPGRPPYFLS